MSQHHVGPDSITVSSLVGDGATGRPTRHRAEPSSTDRAKVAAGVAVATGALIGTAGQLAPAMAQASPSHSAPDANEATVVMPALGGADIMPVAQVQAMVDQITDSVPAPAATVEPVAEPIAAPFGIPNVPPEIAGPLAQAEQFLQGMQPKAAPAPAVRPVAGAISSGFGSRWGGMHYGVDFADALGAPIHSVSSGTVVEAGPASGFGLWVRVLQDDGTTAVYGHVNEMFVHAGQRVNAGDVIATVGNRGQSTGPHLHLEIWDQAGTKIDPMPYMAAKGVPLQWGPSEH
ncbi:M23 family metallopeptidase [Nocardia sp. CNY236]|uniref:M23 family metallopeptidase n=1 Tax=Nocardia sp. CNY236 TaxID=1169152 RepID=UPI00048C35C9|nr:M23 family metallopeptidase [Nocardia sp. CNY236]